MRMTGGFPLLMGTEPRHATTACAAWSWALNSTVLVGGYPTLLGRPRALQRCHSMIIIACFPGILRM